jgi:hypothetical protein
VHYRRILDDKALQEIWTSDSEGKDFQPFGTTIDFYDIKHQRWTAVWIYPAQAMTVIMTGNEVNGSLVLTGHDESGSLQRWSTSAGQRGSIVIRAEISNDEGEYVASPGNKLPATASRLSLALEEKEIIKRWGDHIDLRVPRLTHGGD